MRIGGHSRRVDLRWEPRAPVVEGMGGRRGGSCCRDTSARPPLGRYPRRSKGSSAIDTVSLIVMCAPRIVRRRSRAQVAHRGSEPGFLVARPAGLRALASSALLRHCLALVFLLCCLAGRVVSGMSRFLLGMGTSESKLVGPTARREKRASPGQRQTRREVSLPSQCRCSQCARRWEALLHCYRTLFHVARVEAAHPRTERCRDVLRFAAPSPTG